MFASRLDINVSPRMNRLVSLLTSQVVSMEIMEMVMIYKKIL